MRISAPIYPAAGVKKKRRLFMNNKIVHRWVKEAKLLLTSQEENHIASALDLVDDALSHSPRLETALELKARSLLFLRRFNDVAAMLQDYIPSLILAAGDDQDSSLIDNSSTVLLREKAKQAYSGDETYFKCFSLTRFKKKVTSGLWKWKGKRKKSDKEGQWRYSVLGQACFHLGLVEDALVLLQTAKRLATAASRRQSICWSEDSFSFRELPLCRDFQSTATATTTTTNHNHRKLSVAPPKSENETISQLLSHIKFLLRRKTAAIAALDAQLYSEAIRHFSKILDTHRATPQGFLAQCHMYRGSAYWSAGRLADAIADCNKTLVLDSSCIEALNTRARIFEEIGCITDSLHDLEHLKLLYNSILRDKMQQRPVWKHQSVQYREIPGKLCSLAANIENLKKKVASGEKQNVDYYALIGVRRGCSRSELESAFLLLTLRHKPEKSLAFIDRCEFADSSDRELVREKAKGSASMLYKMIQKGYTCVMNTINMDENGEEKQRKNATLQARMQGQQQAKVSDLSSTVKEAASYCKAKVENKATESKVVIQGVCCRDVGVVGNSVSRVRFNGPNAVKYEARV